MALAVLGASHHDVTVAQLEQLSRGAESIVASLHAVPAVAGAVVLSTCNRLEIYLDTTWFHDAVSAVNARLAQACGLPTWQVGELLRLRVGEEVPAHLFAVAAGLDSMVIGDDSIASQVGQALQAAHERGAATAPLQRLFQSALRTAREVGAATKLGGAGRSVVQVALDVAQEQAQATIGGATALIVGTGSFARVAIAALRRRQVGQVLVYSPSGRAAGPGGFAESHGASAVEGPAGLVGALRDADLAICCSGSTGSVIDAAMLRAAHRDPAAGERGSVLIDLALTPDVAADVRALGAAVVIDLDVVARNAPAEQSGMLDEAREIVARALQRHREDVAARALDPAVVALREHVAKVLALEIERVRQRGSVEQAAETEQSLRRLTSALLHLPTVRARELARSGDHADYVAALNTLFGIEVPAADVGVPLTAVEAPSA
ncbi:MAG: glutamyl-tRNA reductase [Frankiaceae bacterium]|jgi:glutamyl-tRNA reductase|nr:glutamyl-tRNA reductase [Frankiaceae bacterium]